MLQISWKRRGGLDESGKEMAKKVQEALHSSTTVHINYITRGTKKAR